MWICAGCLVFAISSAQSQARAADYRTPPGHGMPTSDRLTTTAPYLILRQPAGGVAVPTLARPYAYGWFGVAARRHTIVHRGYDGSHWHMPSQIAP
jgi:hypothetical protein